MTITTVALANDGSFELFSDIAGHRDYRVIHDYTNYCLPWTVVSDIGEQDLWKGESSFESLDEALDFMVSMATGEFPCPCYSVTLPSGTRFSRPGKVKIEDVMASLGWVFATSVLGYTHKVFGKNTPFSKIEKYFSDLVKDTIAVLGSIEREADDEGRKSPEKVLWIADVTIPVGHFIQIDNSVEYFESLFEEEGIPTDKRTYDFAMRPNVIPHSAKVLDFKAAYEARQFSKNTSQESQQTA